MATTVVEIHVPLRETPGRARDEDPFPWIEKIEDFLVQMEDQGKAEVFDDGEEFGDVYVFSITGGDEDALLGVASRVASLGEVPSGAFAVITDGEAEEFGRGRRVELP
ncbi:hypothetical protein GCM10010156_65690 [Planobispora rosea]|uniref:Uncharacterized protein n=1 Tax=Planobispora rosea TaxID=35762 RepID=A0A8J3S4U6_PLARO|nr:hypothetical protein [Planobispora rosea]GGS98348.1 hypothetical protein GCM10010156_65690 [Planobispora rosea]GIH87892.1 hypothetical protein Pro02_63000 [Planobispora rosea]